MLLYQSKLARDLGKPVFGLNAIALRGGSVKVNHCAKKLITWYDEHHRPLPWRQKLNIYQIWVCEVMSQQTKDGCCYTKIFGILQVDLYCL